MILRLNLIFNLLFINLRCIFVLTMEHKFTSDFSNIYISNKSSGFWLNLKQQQQKK